MSRKPVSVTATKILKNGKPAAKSKTFKSIQEAANWAVSNTNASTVNSAAVNISDTSNGVDHHNQTRKSAFGYIWARSK